MAKALKCKKIAHRFLMVLSLVLAALSSTSLSNLVHGQSAEPSASYRAILERWHAALNLSPSGLSFTPYFGLAGPGALELNASVKQLESIGANMIPFMVKQIRGDLRTLKNAMTASPMTWDPACVNFETAAHKKGEIGTAANRLDRDVELMFMLGGIQIRIGMTDFSTTHWMERIEGFLKEWDAGSYISPESKLRAIREESKEVRDSPAIDYRKTFPYRRYGIYALPFLINEIRDNNSAECFSAFLIITFHRDLYASHYDDPRKLYPTTSDKMSFIRTWWRENKQKLTQLRDLSDKIRTLADSDR
jgi:hypothetical protein